MSRRMISESKIRALKKIELTNAGLEISDPVEFDEAIYADGHVYLGGKLYFGTARFGVQDGRLGQFTAVPAVEQTVEFAVMSMAMDHGTVIAERFDITRAPEGLEYSGIYTVDPGKAKYIVDEDLELIYIIWNLDGTGTYYSTETVKFYGNDMYVPTEVQTAPGVTYQGYIPAHDDFKAFAFEQ